MNQLNFESKFITHNILEFEVAKVTGVFPIFEVFLRHFLKSEQKLHTELTEFYTKRNVLISSQYGFQVKLPTTLALLDVKTLFFENIKDNLFTGLILLDLAKAFATVSHTNLLSKWDRCNICGTADDPL